MKYRIPVTYEMTFTREVEAEGELEACDIVERQIKNGQLAPNILDGPPTGVVNSLKVDYARLRAGV